MDFLFRRVYDPRLAPWQPTSLGRTPPPNVPVGVQLLPREVYAAPRAAASAYQVNSRFVIPAAAPDIPPGGRTFLPDRAPGYPRAAQEAYRIQGRVPPPAPNIQFVQGVTGSDTNVNDGSGGTLSLTWPQTTQQGSVLFCGIVWSGAPGVVSRNIPWARMPAMPLACGTGSIDVYAITNAAPRSGAETFTATNSIGASAAFLAEYKFVNPQVPEEQPAGNFALSATGTGTTVSGAQVHPAASNDAILGILGTASAISANDLMTAAGSGYQLREAVSANNGAFTPKGMASIGLVDQINPGTFGLFTPSGTIASSSNWTGVTIVLQPQEPTFDTPPFPQLMPREVYAPARASAAAYSLTGTVRGTPLPPPDVPVGKQRYPLIAPGYGRAGYTAYEINCKAPPPDAVAPVRPSQVILPSTAPGPARAAHSAYLFGAAGSSTFPPPDLPTPGRPFLPERAPAAERAAPAAYFIAVPVPLAAPLPPGAILCPAAAPGALLAPKSAYEAGGGNVEFYAHGLPRPGCPYRPPRQAPAPSQPGRPSSSVTLPGRPSSGSTLPPRPGDCNCC